MPTHIQLGAQIPVRDGTHLCATLYRPERLPAPCVVILTPYIADSHHERGVAFSNRGFLCAIVNVRGRGNSAGVFRPYIQEADDGHDVIEWLAATSDCNGEVAMSGGSYLAHAQWMAAARHPPHLKTIVPAAAPFLGLDFPMRNNIHYPYLLQWLTFTHGRTAQIKMFSDRAYWSGVFRAWFESGQSFESLNDLPEPSSRIFTEWLAHPHPDDYWDLHNPTSDQYRDIAHPVLTITGSYDDDQPGALEHYRRHLSEASKEVAAAHYLVIGPWDHQGTSTPKAAFGGLLFGAKSLVDVFSLQCDWYEWILNRGPRPPFLKGRVSYYVMGAERWCYADSLEATTAGHDTYFLDSIGPGTDVFGSGLLTERSPAGTPDHYLFDTRINTGLWVEAEAVTDGGSLIDQRLTIALNGHQLVYHSAPFEEAAEVTGFFELVAWISIDSPDTDLYASVSEVTREGVVIRLSTDAIRARYREGLRSPKPVQLNTPLRYDFGRFTFVSREIARGSRLRLVIAPMGRLVETTFAERNFGAGGWVANETSEVGRVITVTLFHDAERPSALKVPRGASHGSA